MQTPISQSLIGAVPVEGGKIPLTKSTSQNDFSALFSLLTQEEPLANPEPEPETAEYSDTEIPDELPFVPEVKTQPPQVAKTSIQQDQKGLVATRGPNGVESNINESKPNQSLPREMAIGHSRRPINTNFEPQNPQQTPIKQRSNLPTSSEFQEPHVDEPRAETRGSIIPNLRQDFISQPIDKRSTDSPPTAVGIPTNQNDVRPLRTGFEHIKPVASEFNDGDRTPDSVSQKLGEWSKAQPGGSQIPATTHQQQMPSILTTAPAKSVEIGDDVDKFKLVSEMTETEIVRLNMNVTTNPTPGSASQAAPAGTVRYAGNQMVDALIRQAGQPVEVALNPEELGRVRIALTSLDTGLSVAIIAERPETLDLMRRHIEQLETEFRQLGYEDIGFEFSGGDTQSSEHPESTNQPASDQMTDIPDPQTPSPISAQTNGVDIRL